MNWIERMMDDPYGPPLKCENCGHVNGYCDCLCCNEPEPPAPTPDEFEENDPPSKPGPYRRGVEMLDPTTCYSCGHVDDFCECPCCHAHKPAPSPDLDPLEKALQALSIYAYDEYLERALVAIRVLKRGHALIIGNSSPGYDAWEYCACREDWPCPVLAEAAAALRGESK
jgi:hypothetical protein